MKVAQALGLALAAEGARQVFGVVGSGNFHITNALVEGGASFVAARHEGGAATMADAYSRMSGEVGLLSVHQGCGLTNAMTGIAEAAKSRSSVLVLAAEVTNRQSNFWVDQAALAESVGAVSARITSGETAIAEGLAAYRTARDQRQTVILNLPLPVQDLTVLELSVPDLTVPDLTVPDLAVQDPPVSPGSTAGVSVADGPVADGPVSDGPVSSGAAPTAAADLADPDPVEVDRLVAALQAADRPVFIAGRGARGAGCRVALEALAERTGALLTTSAVAKGLFNGNPWSLDVSGGFSSPVAADLIREADLIVGWGCALNMWTTRHGRLVGETTSVIQVDLDASAIGAWQPRAEGVIGDVRVIADAALAAWPDAALAALPDAALAALPDAALGADRPATDGYRTKALRARISSEVRWRDVAFDDTSTSDHIDPRALTIALDDLLPADRVVAIDSGNFMGWPSMFLSVPDEFGFCFTQAYQSIGLGLATGIGAALAQPDRLPIAAVGDGGLLMSVAELETVVRLGLPMVVIVYNDAAYGAEVHHFGPDGHPLAIVEFPDTDIAAIAKGFGFEAVTVRQPPDLEPVREWVTGPRDRPMLIDAKISRRASWWLEEAFRGH